MIDFDPNTQEAFLTQDLAMKFYYESMGFNRESTLSFLGEQYYKMALTLTL